MSDSTDSLNPSSISSGVKSDKTSISRPNSVISDIYGVICSWNFSTELKNYVRNNISEYLSRKWNEKTLIHIINKLREQSLIDQSSGLQIPVIQDLKQPKDIVIKSVVANVLWQMDNNHKSSQIQLDTLYNQIWSDAYTTSRLKTHAFSDVKVLKHWRFHQFVKIYSYASGPAEGQKLFLSSSVEGDLTSFFANYINSSGGYKYDSNKFRVVISALRESNPKELLYLTDDPRKARAAIEAGMRALVVLRPGNTQYTEEQMKGLTTITSLDEIEFIEEPGKAAPCC